jgi:hypothetical protein
MPCVDSRSLLALLHVAFYCNCDAKLFGMVILEYLVENSSKVIAAPEKCQSSNRLVELHSKTMAHMARAYLTEKQTTQNFWFGVIYVYIA